MNEALLVRFRSDETMNKKGFSASYVAVDPFEGSEEEISSDSSEMSTPFPGYVYVNSNQLGSRNGENIDNSNENTEDSDTDEDGYSVYENYNLIKLNNKNKKTEPSENGLID